jgi:hypothetical protein
MNNTLRIQLAAVAGLLATAPLAASAEQTAYTASPVAIRSVANDQNVFDIPFASQRLYANAVSVSFVNAANVPATRIEFALTRDGATEHVSNRGSFAPGTTIVTQLDRNATVQPPADATVTVSKVDFADGTSWTPASGRVASATLLQTASR